jgi:hypothetical protein
MDIKNAKMPDQEFTPALRSKGWAPGDYISECGDCGCTHLAAKRAWRCLDCAREALSE